MSRSVPRVVSVEDICAVSGDNPDEARLRRELAYYKSLRGGKGWYTAGREAYQARREAARDARIADEAWSRRDQVPSPVDYDESEDLARQESRFWDTHPVEAVEYGMVDAGE